MDTIDWENYVEEKGDRLNIFRPKKLPVKRPNREGLSVLWASQNNYTRTYPKTCKTDEQKLIHLGKLFVKDEIQEEMFIEFSDVLTLIDKRDKKINQIYDRKAESELKWNLK